GRPDGASHKSDRPGAELKTTNRSPDPARAHSVEPMHSWGPWHSASRRPVAASYRTTCRSAAATATVRPSAEKATARTGWGPGKAARAPRGAPPRPPTLPAAPARPRPPRVGRERDRHHRPHLVVGRLDLAPAGHVPQPHRVAERGAPGRQEITVRRQERA